MFLSLSVSCVLIVDVDGLCSCMLSVRNGLLVIIMLISNHKSLAEQLVACDVTAVLKKCLTLSRAETMLAIIALNHISMVHKLESKGETGRLI